MLYYDDALCWNIDLIIPIKYENYDDLIDITRWKLHHQPPAAALQNKTNIVMYHNSRRELSVFRGSNTQESYDCHQPLSFTHTIFILHTLICICRFYIIKNVHWNSLNIGFSTVFLLSISWWNLLRKFDRIQFPSIQNTLDWYWSFDIGVLNILFFL